MKSTLEKAQVMLEAAKAVPPFSNLLISIGNPNGREYRSFREIFPNMEPTWNWDRDDYRIKPDPIAPGHNPDKLTVKQVGEGWRLLEEEEIAERSTTHTLIQLWCPDSGEWLVGMFDGDNPNNTYRTQKPPGYFLPKPEPKKGVVKMWRYFVRLSDGEVCAYGPCREDAVFSGTVIAKQLVEYPYIEGEGL